MTSPGSRSPAAFSIVSYVPGMVAVVLISAIAVGAAALETSIFGHPAVEALVIAIVLGMLARSFLSLPEAIQPGARFFSKQVLEVAVCLLGASVNLAILVAAGPWLVLGIVFIVIACIAASTVVGRSLKLTSRLSILVACGNAICGNAAIIAVAPVIGADREEVASSIAFTSILGLAMVILLPVARVPLGLDEYQYGVLAGLSVYAVPQVLAAALPVSALAVQVGTLVKLIRVLMLGPVVLFYSVRFRTTRAQTARTGIERALGFLPWFIAGFLLLAVLRSTHVIPESLALSARSLSTWLTIGALAGLGLGVDLKSLMRVGRPMVISVSASLILLMAMSILLIRSLPLRQGITP